MEDGAAKVVPGSEHSDEDSRIMAKIEEVLKETKVNSMSDKELRDWALA